jgi:hypothetical protein
MLLSTVVAVGGVGTGQRGMGTFGISSRRSSSLGLGVTGRRGEVVEFLQHTLNVGPGMWVRIGGQQGVETDEGGILEETSH